MITDRIGRLEVLLPINHKNYNFREKSPSFERKGKVTLNYLQKRCKHFKTIAALLPAKTQKQACARTHVITTLNVIG